MLEGRPCVSIARVTKHIGCLTIYSNALEFIYVNV